ncbi:Tissue factor [Frankliniella fusca]|uniref:Tissue factor n=1 Tax=Frankliniella fusca TaxID=407009 RepID=A0AAE1HN69_9NEOP|nr:Tissue factor [Frankliniella fusca]
MGQKACRPSPLDPRMVNFLQGRKRKLQLEKLKLPSDVVFPESSPSIQSSVPSAPNQENITKPDGSDSSFHVLDFNGLNSWLQSVGLSPIDEKKLKRNKTYCEEAERTSTSALDTGHLRNFPVIPHAFEAPQVLKVGEGLGYIGRQVFFHGPSLFSDKVPEESDEALYFKEMIKQLQDYINGNPERSKKVLALTVLPKSWSHSQIETTFGVTNHMARTSQSVVQSKVGHPLSEETKQLVSSFYLRDDISRPLPGQRDYVSVRENWKRVHKRKRLVLSTLLRLHLKYVEEHPQNYLSSGLFCEMRPKECVLAGSSGTHVVCVCVYPKNPRLMFEGAHLKESVLRGVSECKSLLLCQEPTVSCYLLECDKCPDELALGEKLELYFDEEMIDTVSYNQWITTDRGTLETITKTSDDFISEFIAQVTNLIPHDFIAREQSNFYKKKTENLQEGEVLINFDFAENYSFSIQNSIQSQYFNTKEATVHPYGCAAQYKNKKSVANVWFHEKDLGVPAEWHYYATSHGRSVCDGLKGSVKHKARLHSLRASEPGEQITTPEALYNFAQANMTDGFCIRAIISNSRT